MSIKFCPFCAKPWSGTPFCAYCGKDLRAFINAADAESSAESKNAPAVIVDADTEIAALDSFFAKAAKKPYEAALDPFEVESHGNGKYAIVGLKNRNSLFIEIPDCVDAIGDSAFEGCTAMEISLPESVILIGRRAFAGCTNLEAVKGLGDHVRVIADEAFADCPNLEISIPEGIRLGKDVIRGTLPDQREKARIAEEVRKAEEARLAEEARKAEAARKAFEAIWDIRNGVLKKYKGSGGNVVIPDSVTKIGYEAFRDCKNLTAITIPNSVTSIGENAFCGCANLKSIAIPSSVTSIEKFAFAYCTALESITIPNSVTSIGGWTFEHCPHLTSITIPNSVTSIGQYAFWDCTHLTSITIPRRFSQDKTLIFGMNAYNARITYI